MRQAYTFPDGQVIITETYGRDTLKMQSVSLKDGRQEAQVSEITEVEFDQLHPDRKLTKPQRQNVVNAILKRGPIKMNKPDRTNADRLKVKVS